MLVDCFELDEEEENEEMNEPWPLLIVLRLLMLLLHRYVLAIRRGCAWTELWLLELVLLLLISDWSYWLAVCSWGATKSVAVFGVLVRIGFELVVVVVVDDVEESVEPLEEFEDTEF